MLGCPDHWFNLFQPLFLLWYECDYERWQGGRDKCEAEGDGPLEGELWAGLQPGAWRCWSYLEVCRLLGGGFWHGQPSSICLLCLLAGLGGELWVWAEQGPGSKCCFFHRWKPLAHSDFTHFQIWEVEILTWCQFCIKSQCSQQSNEDVYVP